MFGVRIVGCVPADDQTHTVDIDTSTHLSAPVLIIYGLWVRGACLSCAKTTIDMEFQRRPYSFYHWSGSES